MGTDCSCGCWIEWGRNMERYLWDESARSYRAWQVGGGSAIIGGHGLCLGKLP